MQRPSSDEGHEMWLNAPENFTISEQCAPFCLFCCSFFFVCFLFWFFFFFLVLFSLEWTDPLRQDLYKVDHPLFWSLCSGAKSVCTGSNTHIRCHKVKIEWWRWEWTIKGKKCQGRATCFCHVICPYAVKAEQMSLSTGSGRPGSLGIHGPVKSYMIKGKTAESAVRERGSQTPPAIRHLKAQWN